MQTANFLVSPNQPISKQLQHGVIYTLQLDSLSVLDSWNPSLTADIPYSHPHTQNSLQEVKIVGKVQNHKSLDKEEDIQNELDKRLVNCVLVDSRQLME